MSDTQRQGLFFLMTWAYTLNTSQISYLQVRKSACSTYSRNVELRSRSTRSGFLYLKIILRCVLKQEAIRSLPRGRWVVADAAAAAAGARVCDGWPPSQTHSQPTPSQAPPPPHHTTTVHVSSPCFSLAHTSFDQSQDPRSTSEEAKYRRL